MIWDLFCRVIDNHGDLGVCWRLAADLGARGEQVRLWVDDASALSWMAPLGASGVDLRGWPSEAEAAIATPGEVVIEAFGCALPAAFVARMAAAGPAPVWINLEYLSAEDYVERSHRLQSPQPNGLRKWFFYPGFTPRTGGLIREPDLAQRRAGFDAAGWLAGHGVLRQPGEQVVSLFCYEQPALPALLDAFAHPTLLLATPGHAARQVRALLGPGLRRGALRACLLPPLTQRTFDELLWTCDLNLVRGEDSFVRAQWAARPFLWQIYPQHDDVHFDKLNAFLERFLAGAAPALGQSVRAAFLAWNGSAPQASSALPQASPAHPQASPALPHASRALARPSLALPSAPDWAAQAARWCSTLAAQTDLVSQLISFVAETR